MFIKMVSNQLKQHLLSTLITSFSVALATGLLMAVIVLQAQSYQAMTAGATRFDAVLGARGSSLQLVLNTVFHLDVSPGNIPYSMYQTIKADPRVLKAFPYAVGDNYKGFRIVATEPEFFMFKSSGKAYEFEQGNVFNPSAREAVLGSFVAQQTRLKIGDMFNAYHGVVFDESMKHPGEFKVVGILKPTNSPTDRVIWTSLDAFFSMPGHIIHDEISAVMLKLKNPAFGSGLEQMINKQGKVATLAWPIAKISADYLNKMNWFNKVLILIIFMIMFIALGTIVAGIYNAMDSRQRDFAIMRCLGARRNNLMSLILLESASMAFIGAMIGFIIYSIILLIAGYLLRAGTGVVINPFVFHPIFLIVPIATTLLGLIVGLIPAIKVYRLPVVESLQQRS